MGYDDYVFNSNLISRKSGSRPHRDPNGIFKGYNITNDREREKERERPKLVHKVITVTGTNQTIR